MLKWALVSDLHIPYHNKKYVTMWLEYLKYWKPDAIDIAGDFDDAQCVSKYADGTPKEHTDLIATYSPMVKQLLADIREIVPNADIALHGGNHEIRYDNYIDRKAPALSGLITPELLWGVDTYGVTYHSYSDLPVKRYGQFYVHHGNFAVKGAGNSVRKMIDEFGVSCIVGHCHRLAAVSQTFELTGEIRTGIELGNLCDLSSNGFRYTNLRDWQPGFGFAYVDGEKAHSGIVPILDNSFVFEGRKFSA